MALEDQGQRVRGTGGAAREVELVAEVLEQLPALQDLAVEDHVVGVGTAQGGLAGAARRHGDHALHRRAPLIAAGILDRHLGRQQLGARRDLRGVGVEGGHPLPRLFVGFGHHPLLEDVVSHPLAEHPADAAGDLIAVPAAVGDRRQALIAAGAARAAGEQSGQAVDRAPHPERPGAPMAVEHDDELGADAVRMGVEPDLHGPDHVGAEGIDARAGRAVEQQDAGALVVQGAEHLLGQLDVGLPVILELVADGTPVGVPGFPEMHDEGVALIILLQGQESLQLVVGDQQIDRLQPVLVLLGELLDRLLHGLAFRAADLFVGRAGGSGEQGAESQQEEGGDDQRTQSTHSFTFLKTRDESPGKAGAIQQACRAFGAHALQ